MLTRRLILAGLATGLAVPARAQGKKGATDTMALLGVDGVYDAHGMNPDGTTYSGRVDIVQQGDAVEMTWAIGSDTYRGQGTLEGRVLTVDWGAATPVVYVVMPNGELHGTWDGGTALEKLTPR